MSELLDKIIDAYEEWTSTPHEQHGIKMKEEFEKLTKQFEEVELKAKQYILCDCGASYQAHQRDCPARDET